MKISVQQYAQSLFESVSGKSEKEVKVVLHNFVALLGQHQDLNKEAAIIEAFQKIWNEEKAEVAATLSSARQLETKTKEMVVDYLKDRTSAQKISLTENIDKDLIGGFVLRYGSQILDGSLKTSLASLKNKLEK
jgi:F-type H+-transporting ATPase subunit delta